jgi:hypothetical protein
MKEEILKLVNKIKDNLKDIDNDGVSHPLLDDVYDSLALIEDSIYDDDMLSSGLDMDDEDY